jgi:GNAT superfamily N-acetyltransferase
MTDPWSNVVWRALTGPQSRFAQVHRSALRYDPDVAPFAALPDQPTDTDWDDLAGLAAGQLVTLFRAATDHPPAWSVIREYPCFQMHADGPLAPPTTSPVMRELGPPDVPRMVELTDMTHPGPFFDRTIELGTYLGIFDGDRLMSMAGERFRFDGATEVSAVCTHPQYRGRGLSHALVVAVTNRIIERGERPFLHVIRTNPARRVYDDLGFRVHNRPTAMILAPPGVVADEAWLHDISE